MSSRQSKQQSDQHAYSSETSSGFKPFGKGGMSLKLDNIHNQQQSSLGQMQSPSDNSKSTLSRNQLSAAIQQTSTPRRLDILTNNNNVLRESSMIFMSKLHFKPFIYGRCNEKLNMNLLDNTDVEVVEMNGDIGGSSKLLRNIAFTDFNTDLVEKMGFENFSKILRLWQLTINDFGLRQKEEQEKGEKLYTQYRQHLDANQKIDAIKKTHSDRKTQLTENLKNLQQQVNELKALSNKTGKFKCTYCEKTFDSKEKVKSHIDTIHKDMLKDIKQERQVIENLGNPIKNMTRREEKQMEENNRILAEKVARDVEQKMSEQLKKLIDKQEELRIKRELDENIRQLQDQGEEVDPAGKSMQLATSIQKMNSVFGGFEDMFNQMQTKQQGLISEQAQQNIRLLEIERDQKRLEQEKEEQQREMQEQLRTIHQQQQLRIELAMSKNEGDEYGENGNKTQIIEELSLQREPNFGNPFFAAARRSANQSSMYGDEDNKENTSSKQNQSGRIPISTRQQFTQEQLQFSQNMPAILSGGAYGNDMGVSKRSDLKKQFREKYVSDEETINEEKKRIKRLQHLGEIESDYDSDLIDELDGEVDKDLLIPTNQNQLLRNAELAFKEKLMKEEELNNIQKNNYYRMAVLRNETKAYANENSNINNTGGANKKLKSNYYFETNASLNVFTPIEQERRKNERLISEVILMNEKRMNGQSDEPDYYGQQQQQQSGPNYGQEKQDIGKMKRQFISDQLNFQFQENDEDIMELDEEDFLKLKQTYNSKFIDNQVINPKK